MFNMPLSHTHTHESLSLVLKCSQHPNIDSAFWDDDQPCRRVSKAESSEKSRGCDCNSARWLEAKCLVSGCEYYVRKLNLELHLCLTGNCLPAKSEDEIEVTSRNGPDTVINPSNVFHFGSVKMHRHNSMKVVSLEPLLIVKAALCPLQPQCWTATLTAFLGVVRFKSSTIKAFLSETI